MHSGCGTPAAIRTRDLPLRRRTLYPLSYRGMDRMQTAPLLLDASSGAILAVRAISGKAAVGLHADSVPRLAPFQQANHISRQAP